MKWYSVWIYLFGVKCCCFSHISKHNSHKFHLYIEESPQQQKRKTEAIWCALFLLDGLCVHFVISFPSGCWFFLSVYILTRISIRLFNLPISFIQYKQQFQMTKYCVIWKIKRRTEEKQMFLSIKWYIFYMCLMVKYLYKVFQIYCTIPFLLFGKNPNSTFHC